MGVCKSWHLRHCLATWVPTQCKVGFFTEGVTAETADRERECPENSFCKDGELKLCPKGKFGNQKGNSDPNCSGDCLAGFNCPEGSNVNNKEACAPIGDLNPRKYYCPAGLGRQVAGFKIQCVH